MEADDRSAGKAPGERPEPAEGGDRFPLCKAGDGGERLRPGVVRGEPRSRLELALRRDAALEEPERGAVAELRVDAPGGRGALEDPQLVGRGRGAGRVRPVTRSGRFGAICP